MLRTNVTYVTYDRTLRTYVTFVRYIRTFGTYVTFVRTLRTYVSLVLAAYAHLCCAYAARTTQVGLILRPPCSVLAAYAHTRCAYAASTSSYVRSLCRSSQHTRIVRARTLRELSEGASFFGSFCSFSQRTRTHTARTLRVTRVGLSDLCCTLAAYAHDRASFFGPHMRVRCESAAQVACFGQLSQRTKDARDLIPF